MRWETRRLGVTRILIADDHEVVRAGLRRMLESQPSWEVVAEVADGKDAISKAVETKPDIAVLDYSLPLVNGIEATRQIRARLPKTEVLIFTMHDNETLIQDLLKAGARGYLLKTDANHHLISAIEALASHKPFFTAKISEALLELVSCRPDPAGICSHQPGTRYGAADRRGHTNKKVATVLTIGLKTVETHRATIMRKLDPWWPGAGEKRSTFEARYIDARPQHHQPSSHPSCNARPDHTLGSSKRAVTWLSGFEVGQ